jgi:hypothetical protein
MSNTHFHDDHRRIVPNRAYSYEPAGGGFQASPLNYANVGATSLFTTAPDLAKWLDNFREPKVGGVKALARLQEQAVLANGETIPYALGLAIGKFRGLRAISHGGSDAGYRSYVAWFPEQRLGIAVLSHLASLNPGNIANEIATVYLDKQMDAEPVTTRPVTRTFITLESGEVDRYEGYYRLGDPLIQVVKKDGKLLAAPPGSPLLELRPMSATRFYAEQMQAELFRKEGPNGNPTYSPGGARSKANRSSSRHSTPKTWRNTRGPTGAMNWRRSTRSC